MGYKLLPLVSPDHQRLVTELRSQWRKRKHIEMKVNIRLERSCIKNRNSWKKYCFHKIVWNCKYLCWGKMDNLLEISEDVLGFSNQEVNIRKWENIEIYFYSTFTQRGCHSHRKGCHWDWETWVSFYMCMGRSSHGMKSLQRLEPLLQEQLKCWFTPLL